MRILNRLLQCTITVFLLATGPSGPTQTDPSSGENVIYKSPLYMVLSHDGSILYCVFSEAGSLGIIDTREEQVLAEIPVGPSPFGLVLSSDKRKAYVTLREKWEVVEVDLEQRAVKRRIPTGFDPCGVSLGPEERTLYVANTAGSDISIIDLSSGKEKKRLIAGERPRWVVRSPDGNTLVATSFIAHVVPFRTPPINEFTWLDGRQERVVYRTMVQDVLDVERPCFSHDGRLAVVGISRPKNLLPLVQLEQGWAMTNALALFDMDHPEDAVIAPLDDMSQYHAEPRDVLFSPDDKWLYVVCGAGDRVLFVSMERLLETADSLTPEKRQRWADDLASSPQYVMGQVPVGRAPRAGVLSPNGSRLYVSNELDDTISVIDTRSRRLMSTIDLGGPEAITVARRGEQVFSWAAISYQSQLSCHSCHPDGHVDGLTWDIEPDGLGLDVVDNRSLRDVGPTAPFKWNGKNPDLMHQCGPRAALFFFRSKGFEPDDLHALHVYIKGIPLPPNPHRPPAQDLTEAQRRGREIFFRSVRNDGSVIPPLGRCYTCHFGEYTTDRRKHNVGTFVDTDLTSDFDSAHLTALYDAPPYLHDGSALTMEEVWSVTGPNHGATGDLTKSQFNDLVEFIKSL